MILKIILDSPLEPSAIIWVIIGETGESESERDLKKAVLLICKMLEEDHQPRNAGGSRSWARQRNDYLLEDPKGTQVNTLILAQRDLYQSSILQNRNIINLCSFTALCSQ